MPSVLIPLLEGLTTGVRLANPTLKVVQQSHHAQFVIYSVPDDVAEAFECQNPLPTFEAKPARRRYGNYFGTIFYVGGRKNTTVALLWARDNDYWKIVAWQTGFETRAAPPPDTPDVKIVRAAADRSLVDAARDFLESWFIRKDYGSTFQYLSERSYACYNLMRDPEQPEATSTADAALKIRAAIERAGQEAGTPAGLDQLLSSVEPVHPAVHLLYHRYARTFACEPPDRPRRCDGLRDSSKGTQFTGVTGIRRQLRHGVRDECPRASGRRRGAGAAPPVARTDGQVADCRYDVKSRTTRLGDRDAFRTPELRNRRRHIQEHDWPERWQVAHLGGRMFRGRWLSPSL